MIFEPVSRAQVLQIAQAGINDISRLAAQPIDKHMVLAIIRAGLQSRFEAGQNVLDFLRFKIPCTADGAAVRAACSQIAMAPRHTGRAYSTGKGSGFCERIFPLSGLFQISGKSPIAAPPIAIRPKAGRPFVCVGNHDLVHLYRRLLCLFVFHLFCPPFISAAGRQPDMLTFRGQQTHFS